MQHCGNSAIPQPAGLGATTSEAFSWNWFIVAYLPFSAVISRPGLLLFIQSAMPWCQGLRYLRSTRGCWSTVLHTPMSLQFGYQQRLQPLLCPVPGWADFCDNVRSALGAFRKNPCTNHLAHDRP